VKAARDIDRVRPKEDAIGVDQVEIGAGDVGLNRAVDLGPLPPVTRLITLPMVAGPLKVALSGVERQNCPKLWKRLLPTCLPRLAPIE
jgi:hypothetical protein